MIEQQHVKVCAWFSEDLRGTACTTFFAVRILVLNMLKHDGYFMCSLGLLLCCVITNKTETQIEWLSMTDKQVDSSNHASNLCRTRSV